MSHAPQHRAPAVRAQFIYRNLSMTLVAEMPGGKVLRHAAEPHYLVFIKDSDLASALVDGTARTHPRRAF